jgi:alcohol dehydrogenase
MSAVMIGAALGARVVAVDVSRAALERARALGADVVVDGGQDPDVATTIHEITRGGAAVSIDALGSTATAVTSVRCLRRRGRHVQVGLLLGAAATPPIAMDRVIAWELEIHGSHGMAAREYPAMLALIADGTLRPDLLVGEVIGLEDAGAALAAMDRSPSAAGMTVIDPST